MMTIFSALEFDQPWFLFAGLLAIPVFFAGRHAAGRLVFSSLGLLPTHWSWRARLAWVPDLVLAVAVLFFAVALAGPRKADQKTRVEREGIAIMMVVDTSGSMRALDLSTKDTEQTRLEAVKSVFVDFVGARADDSIGVVSFAGFADTRCPLTLDHDNLTTIASSLTIVTERSEDGTAIGDGLGLAVERLRNAKVKSRVAILLTDGVNNAGDETPLAAAELAVAEGVKVYTIGAGTTGRAPVRVKDPFSGRDVLRHVEVQIDEETLKAIAERTGGTYFRATDAEGLASVYEQIDRLETTSIVDQRYGKYREFYRLALALALLLAALAWLLRASIFRRLP